MQIFITGTDTGVGKTIVSSWLCLHTKYGYFKPIQTGRILDSHTVRKIAGISLYKEVFVYGAPLSPHLAASLENCSIDIDKIQLPKADNLIIEGTGGILVPINKTQLMVDLIKKVAVPIILVARSTLGTINHTLLTLEALRAREIPILGVILNGPPNADNLKAIEFYGGVKVLASIPKLQQMERAYLMQIPFSTQLKDIFFKTNNNEFK